MLTESAATQNGQEMTSGNIVITGANGFVGSHALLALAEDEGVSSRLVAACRDQAKIPPAFHGRVHEGDLRDPAYRQALVQNADTIVHAAAWTSLYGHKRQSHALFLEPSLALLGDAMAAGVKRFIMISSTACAPPPQAHDANAPGQAPDFWPHLGNVIAIEDAMRAYGDVGAEMISLRLGLFTGQRYSLGLLPVLVPRLKSHLVPWVAGGRTPLPLIAGEDVGQAVACAVRTQRVDGYQGFNILGPETPKVRDVITFLADEFSLPKPWFSVPFPIAHVFAWSMEQLSKISPWNPFITRSIIYLMRDFGVDNGKARIVLGYLPRHDWHDAVRRQFAEMHVREARPMPLARPIKNR